MRGAATRAAEEGENSGGEGREEDVGAAAFARGGGDFDDGGGAPATGRVQGESSRSCRGRSRGGACRRAWNPDCTFEPGSARAGRACERSGRACPGDDAAATSGFGSSRDLHTPVRSDAGSETSRASTPRAIRSPPNAGAARRTSSRDAASGADDARAPRTRASSRLRARSSWRKTNAASSRTSSADVWTRDGRSVWTAADGSSSDDARASARDGRARGSSTTWNAPRHAGTSKTRDASSSRCTPGDVWAAAWDASSSATAAAAVRRWGTRRWAGYEEDKRLSARAAPAPPQVACMSTRDPAPARGEEMGRGGSGPWGIILLHDGDETQGARQGSEERIRGCGGLV